MASTMAVVPTFRKRGDLGQVGVADDHVEPAEALGVGVRLVAGVDDGPLERRLEPDDLLEELGPLRDLEVDRLGVERRRLGSDLARAGEEGARDEVRAPRPSITLANGTDRSIM